MSRSNIKKIGRDTSISYSTLLRLRDGGDIYLSTAERLSEYLQEGDATEKARKDDRARWDAAIGDRRRGDSRTHRQDEG